MLLPFEDVVTTHGPTVWRVCRAQLPPADAEDVWSETFLAALRAYARLDPGANVEAWLVTIAHRKVVDHHRARARRPVPVDVLPADAAPSDPGAVDRAPHEAAAERLDLWDALGGLTVRQREAVAYHYLAGLPYDDVAGLVGGTAAAARRAAADGIGALRAVYRGGTR